MIENVEIFRAGIQGRAVRKGRIAGRSPDPSAFLLNGQPVSAWTEVDEHSAGLIRDPAGNPGVFCLPKATTEARKIPMSAGHFIQILPRAAPS